MRPILAVLAVGFTLLLALGQWARGAFSDEVMLECWAHVDEELAHERVWEWFPPGWVCLYEDGTRHHTGLS